MEYTNAVISCFRLMIINYANYSEVEIVLLIYTWNQSYLSGIYLSANKKADLLNVLVVKHTQP